MNEDRELPKEAECPVAFEEVPPGEGRDRGVAKIGRIDQFIDPRTSLGKPLLSSSRPLQRVTLTFIISAKSRLVARFDRNSLSAICQAIVRHVRLNAG